jgi:hypothetical protein
MGLFMVVLGYCLFLFAFCSFLNRFEEERCYGCSYLKYRDLGTGAMCDWVNPFSTYCPNWECSWEDELVSYEVVALKPTQKDIDLWKHLSLKKKLKLNWARFLLLKSIMIQKCPEMVESRWCCFTCFQCEACYNDQTCIPQRRAIEEWKKMREEEDERGRKY